MDASLLLPFSGDEYHNLLLCERFKNGHAQLKFVMTECSKTQIRLTGLIC